jgi:hypothetical protein
VGKVINIPSEAVTVTSFSLPPLGMEAAGVEVIVRLRKTKDMRRSATVG